MKKLILTTFAFMVIGATSHALSPVVEWRGFSKSYSSSEYTLRDDISYFELRKYLFDKQSNKQVSDKYIPYLPIYRKSLSSFPSNVVDAFQQIKFDNGQPPRIAELSTDSPRYIFKVKGFIIKNDNKFWIINEKQDFVWLFDKIDTEGELYQFLQINKLLAHENSYKVEGSGYAVKSTEVKYHSKKKTIGSIDEYTEYQVYTSYIYHIKSNGEFSKEFFSKRKTDETKTQWGAGFHGDPPLAFGVPTLDDILNDSNFVTPPKIKK